MIMPAETQQRMLEQEQIKIKVGKTVSVEMPAQLTLAA